MSNKSVIGIVNSQSRAEGIVATLQSAGFGRHDISALLPDRRGTTDFAHEANTKAPEGTVVGVAGGGVLGGTLGLLAGIGALAIPGLGAFLAAGPLMAAMSGVAAGATLGGAVGALVGLGIPEVEAKKYEGKLTDDNILLAVHVNDSTEEARAREVFHLGGASDISATSEASVPSVDLRN
jgi:hypothetical protein